MRARASTVDHKSSSAIAPPGEKRLIFFPFPVLWFSIVALEISVIAGLRIADADIWFHLRNARELLSRHSFLGADSYTFTAAGTRLMNFEWLSELPYYLAFQGWGLRGLLAIYLILIVAIFGSVYYLALRRGANCVETSLVTMAAVAVGCYSFGPRMLHFGWLCLVALMLVLERFESTGKGLWFLPPLFALWINLHGSWPFGFVVMVIYIVSGTINGHWNNVTTTRWTRPQLRKLLTVSVASMAALLINPYGYKLLWYPFELLNRQQPVRDSIIEWQSVDFHSIWGKLAMLMIFTLLTAAWFSPGLWKLRDILLVFFALATSLSHIRFLLFAAIILVPILAPRLRLFEPYDAEKDKPWLNLAMTAIIAGMIVWMYPSAAQLQRAIDSQFPRDALRFMEQRRITGRLFHYYDFGGYIEFYAPEVKTFADGRADIFIYNGVFDDYLKVNKIDAPFEVLNKYKIDYVLFPVDKHLCYLLDHSSQWRSIYRDKVVNLYERVPAGSAVPEAQLQKQPFSMMQGS
jgi:hypothetical protein